MQEMKLIPDPGECAHDLESEDDMLSLDGRLGSRCNICKFWVFKGRDSRGRLNGQDQIGKMFDV
jgi:hypothetical protein